MKRPVRVHDVQKLTGCLAALSQFISRLGEKALPLYRLMKKSDMFEWTPEADVAFAELKTLLSVSKLPKHNKQGAEPCKLFLPLLARP